VFFRPPNDVSAVVLSTGEPSTQRATDSLHRQTMPLRNVIVVRDISPFHKALNVGAAKVETPFFVQIDADMLLDSHCVAALRRGMRRRVGIVVGHLRDPLVGQVVGVKLFRTACFKVSEFPDTISPDTDFVDAIARVGWKTAYIGRRFFGRSPHPWHTFGEHRPDYSPAYTYRKFLLEGQRYRYRQKLDGLRWLLDRLTASGHPASLIAQIGLARGFFATNNRDDLTTAAKDREWLDIGHFFSAAITQPMPSNIILPAADVGSRERFQAFFRLGNELFQARDLPTLKSCMDALANVEHWDRSLLAKLALCRGLSNDAPSDAAIEADYRILSNFLGSNDLESVAAYAARIGLRRFVIDGSRPAEYRIDRSSEPPICRPTERPVKGRADPTGRPRINPPFAPLGHVICTQAARASSVFYCFDLIRSGYLFAHLPTALGPRRVLLAKQLAKNCLAKVGWSSRTAIVPFESRAGGWLPTQADKDSARSFESYMRVGDHLAFVGQSFAPREVFSHLAVALHKPYPDAQLLLEKRGMPRQVLQRGNFVQINVYTTDFYGLPDELFSDLDLNWHHQQFGSKGLIAAAGLWIQDRTATVTTLQSDLCQQLYRHTALRRTCKTQVETRFKYWYAILFNAILDFCVANELLAVHSPTGEEIVENTEHRIAPDLFLRIYNYPEHRYVCRRTRRSSAEYWEIPVTVNTSRIVRLRPEAIASQQETRPRICLFHDIEENVDTSISPAECADNLSRMLSIEKEFGIATTYNVLGTLLEQKRSEILGSNPEHSIGFHSFDHRIGDLDQLRQCRQVDLRVKGYRPARSKLTAGLADYNLTQLNFEWLACSAHDFGFDACKLENGLVKIPIAVDDYPLFTGTVRYDQWARELLRMAASMPFFAFGLHDCYARHWLEHYPHLLEELAKIGDFATADAVSNRMFLPGTSTPPKLAANQFSTNGLPASVPSQLHA